MLKDHAILSYTDNTFDAWDAEWRPNMTKYSIVRYFFGHLCHSVNPYIYFIDENIKKIVLHRLDRS